MTVAAPLTAALLLSAIDGGSTYRLRPFDASSRDQLALEQICRNVYGGRDYLPRTAASLVADPLCTFLVLADKEEDRPVAVANARRFQPGMAWLEAVRTCEKHRGKGLARRLTQSLIEIQKNNGNEMFTCTVGSNLAMQKVFDKVGMHKLHEIHQCSFAALSALPGWAAHDADRPPQHLLQALEAEDCISNDARKKEWIPVKSEHELVEVLQRVKAAGGIGHLPGLYELLSRESIEESLCGGRIWKIKGDDDSAAVFALVRDEKIGSLRSKWVCSVAASTCTAFEAALWHACSEDCLSMLGDDVAFTLSFDGAIPMGDEPNSLSTALPLVDDPCLLFGTSQTL